MAALALTVPSGITPVSAHHLQFQAQGCDPFTNTQEFLHPGILQSPMALKAKKSRDPDLPSLRESLSGQHSEEFWAAMDTEIDSLEEKGTWTVTDRSEVPADAKVVPVTWVQRIKRHPDGRLNKFKSRVCYRGDLDTALDENPYSPLVGWPTVRAGLLLAATHG